MNKLLLMIFITLLATTFLWSQSGILPILREEKENRHLGQSGQYNSLIEAVKEAQKNEQITEMFVPEAFEQSAKLTASDGVGGDHFGYSVAISGDTAIVGAYQDDVGINDRQGSAYIFVRSGTTWVQQQKLIGSGGAALDYFGISVAVSGDIAIVGAYQAAGMINGTTYNDLGAAYVFVRSGTTWTEQVILRPILGPNNLLGPSTFGISVALSGDTAVVGMTGEDVGSSQEVGSAYVFVRSGSIWGLQQKLTASDAIGFDAFGKAVAINGDTIVVGATGINRSPGSAGLAYVFVRSGSTWTQQQKLTASDATADDYFGSSVAVNGNNAIIGAYADDISVPVDNAGSAYVFVRSGTTWTQQQKLIAPDGASQDAFGRGVAVSGDIAVVGAEGDNIGTINNQGSAYVFARSGTTWTLQQKLMASDGTANDGLGFSVAMSGNILLIGGSDININIPTDETGLAYIFRMPSLKPIFDFDGDGKTDISIFRPSAGEWWINRSSTGVTVAAPFGASSDKPVPADFTGDGKTDIAFWRPSTGYWFILRSEDSSFLSFPFGTSGDVPVVGDYDGDGKSDVGVFRPASNEWFISKSSGGTIITTFGTSGDVPVTADYDGDGKTDIAIYRPSAGQWWIQRSGNSSVVAAAFGNSTDKPVQGDYSGDGKADIAFWRPSTGEWFILRSEDGSFYSVPFGSTGDLPAPGDYDGDGKFDTAVFRPSGSTWFINRTTAGILITGFGVNGDQPVPNVFVP